MTTIEELLRRLALQDESALQPVMTLCADGSAVPGLSARTQAIARLGALVALRATGVSYQAAVIEALAAGITAEEVVGTLLAVAPLVGVASVTEATSAIGLALGYDLDDALEQTDQPFTEAGWRDLRDGAR